MQFVAAYDRSIQDEEQSLSSFYEGYLLQKNIATIIPSEIQIICNCRKEEQQCMAQKIFTLEATSFGPQCPFV